MIVELAGLELHGRHGVLDHEREHGQRFLYDVWLDVAEPARDEIGAALDYRDVVAAVRDVNERAFQLLETLAAALADELLARFPAATAARVRVRKPDVDLGVPVEHSAVTAERSRATSS